MIFCSGWLIILFCSFEICQELRRLKNVKIEQQAYCGYNSIADKVQLPFWSSVLGNNVQ